MSKTTVKEDKKKTITSNVQRPAGLASAVLRVFWRLTLLHDQRAILEDVKRFDRGGHGRKQRRAQVLRQRRTTIMRPRAPIREPYVVPLLEIESLALISCEFEEPQARSSRCNL
jgi:hypothetical protein